MSILSAVLQEAEKVTLEERKQQLDEININLVELTEKVQMLSWAVQQNLIDLYINFTHTKTLEQINYNKRKDNIFSDYEKITDRINQLSAGKRDWNDENLKVIQGKLDNNFLILKDLCIAAESKRKLWFADHQFRRYKYREAISEIENVRKALKELKLKGDLDLAVKNVYSMADNQFSLYIAQISVEWEELFSWSEQKSLYHSTYTLSVEQYDPILMKNVLGALYLAQRLNDELALFSDFFINSLLHTMIRHNCEISTDENLGAILFIIKIDLKDKTKPTSHSIFNNLTAVFEFLQSTLDSHFEGGDKFIGILAQTIKGDFFNKIINDCVKTVLPTCEKSYENYKNLIMELDSFNKFLIELKFVDATESPLNEYMNTECVLYKKKYDNLLADVRVIMKESLSYGTLSVGEDKDEQNDFISNTNEEWDIITKPLFLPKCVISQNVKKVMSLILSHLVDSVKFPEKFSNQLVLYIKDIAVMYQWLVPNQFKVNLESCPLDIALFFNNCFYLAHGLLGPSWRNILPLTLADNLNTILIESIHDLRVLGLEKMALYLQKQKDVIAQEILPKDPTPWTYETYRQFNSAVADALAVMKDLRSSWWGILPTRMYAMSMCNLAQALCQCMLNRLLTDNHPIEEDIVLQIRCTFNNTRKEIEVLFEEVIQLEKDVNLWSKFIKIAHLLKAQLGELSELWNESKELSPNFSCEEVRKIIKMRFPDDNLRFKTLADIQ